MKLIWKTKSQSSDVGLSPVDQVHRRLVALYEGSEPPRAMVAEFEHLLDRHAQSRGRTGLNTHVHTSQMRMALGVASIAIAFALLFVVAFAGLPGENRDGVAEAMQFLQNVPDGLSAQPGQVLHTKTEVYQRYGPKADVIGERTGIPTENHVRESWIEVGASETITNSRGRLIDANSITVQEAFFDGARRYEVNPATGEVLRDEPTSPRRINVPKARANDLQKALVDGTSRVIAQTESQIVIESIQDVPSQLAEEKSDPNDYDVPYIADLSPKKFLVRETIGKDGVTLAYEVLVVTGSGTEVVVLSERTITNELLDSIPAN